MAKNKKNNIEKKAEKREQTRFLNALELVLDILPERTREILKKRYGVKTEYPLTLEEIGRQYGITRERVRQILKDSMKKIKKNTNYPIFTAIESELEFTVGRRSGIIKEMDLLVELAGEEPDELQALKLILELTDAVRTIDESDHHEKVVTHINFNMEKRKKVEDAVHAYLEAIGITADHQNLFQEVKKINSELEIEIEEFFHYLAPSRRIRKNNFGKWGLSSWSQISPKVTWERAYLILKEENRPLHFRDIAKLIDKHNLSKKKSHPQTVHNELIRNEKFVLIGRGIYALSEWGYKHGTVKDIIQDIMKKNTRPMPKDEILEQILKVRKVKKSTVLINLNNYFVRTGNDQYFVKR